MTQTLIFNIKRSQSNIILCMQSIQHKSNRIGKNNTESQLKSTTTNKNPSICMAVPCSNNWVDCFLFLRTEFLIVYIDASCNLHDAKKSFWHRMYMCVDAGMCMNPCLFMFMHTWFCVYGKESFRRDLAICNDNQNMILSTTFLHNIYGSLNYWGVRSWPFNKVKYIYEDSTGLR